MWIENKWPKFRLDNGKVESAHSVGGWISQYNRMIRFYLRCSDAMSDDSENYLDFAFAFFQNCFHLRDWLKNSFVLTDFDHVWGGFVKNYPQIKFCRDICNGTKHYLISRPTVDDEFFIYREYDPWSKSDIWYVNFQEQSCTLDDLMRDCVKAWDSFIKLYVNLTVQREADGF